MAQGFIVIWGCRKKAVCDTLTALLERCQSGRMGRPAKALPGLNRAVGSNPTLSASNYKGFSVLQVSGGPNPVKLSDPSLWGGYD